MQVARKLLGLTLCGWFRLANPGDKLLKLFVSNSRSRFSRANSIDAAMKVAGRLLRSRRSLASRAPISFNGIRKPNTILGFLMRVASHSPAQGALSILYPATMPDVTGGEYYGPDGFLALTGFPKRISYSRSARDWAEAARYGMWQKISRTYDSAIPSLPCRAR
jgi:hypothetical protein